MPDESSSGPYIPGDKIVQLTCYPYDCLTVNEDGKLFDVSSRQRVARTRLSVMHKHTHLLLLVALLVISCARDAATPRAEIADEPERSLRDILTVGRWRSVISEGLPSEETRTYQFFPNGKYRFVLVSDFEYRDDGTWKVTKQDDGSFLLTLAKTRDKPGAHFLFEKSQIEYDREADRLLVTGPNYAVNAYMRHVVE